MSRPASSRWNPSGNGLNCSACVARHLYWKLFGHYLPDDISNKLDGESQPRTLEQAFGQREQIQMAFSRTEALIQQVGLKLVERRGTGFGMRHPAGHYAVMSVESGAGGHVVYGYASTDDSELKLFDPQADENITWGHLASAVVATRFIKP